MRRFPKDVFVKFANEGTDEEWLSADDDVTALLEQGKKIRVARYTLVETGEGWLSPEMEIRKVRKA